MKKNNLLSKEHLRISIPIALATLLISDLSLSQDLENVEILSSTVCSINKNPKLFVSTKQTVASPILSKKLPIHRVDHQIYLKLTRYSIQPDLSSIKSEAIVWQESSYGIGPGFNWKSYLEFDPQRGHLFLIFSLNSSPNLVLWAYEIDPSGITQAKLGEFTPDGYAKHVPQTEREKPLSDRYIKEYQVFGGPRCLPEDRMSSMIENDSILVSVSQTQEENCPPLYFRFDFKTKKWQEINHPG